MSRHFDLLCNGGNGYALFSRTGKESLLTDNGHHHVDLGGQTETEEAAKLVQRVFLFSNSHAPRTVVFSSVEGSGSSEFCCNAGKNLAAAVPGSVCLVDANLHTPLLHRLLGVGKSPGLADTTVRPSPIKDVAVKIAGRNIWVVPPGSHTAEAHHFASDGLRSLVGELREHFDYVLIDAPPVSFYADAVLLGQVADGLILVVKANSTRRETARMVKDTLEHAQVKILGAILSDYAFPIPESIYRRL